MGDSDDKGRPAESWFASELAARVASAAVLIPIALAATWYGGLAFTLFWLAAAIAILHEWLTMARAEPRVVLFSIASLAFVVTALAPHVGAPAYLAPLAALVGFSLVLVLAAGRRNRLWAAGGVLVAAVILIVPPAVRAHPLLGIAGIAWMFAVVWGSDTAAYFTGRALGGPKLMPRVSPKKTWSGFLGGAVAATAVGVLVAYFAMAASVAGGYAQEAPGSLVPVSLTAVALLSALAAALGQAGDLAESAMKRHFGVKDSSRLIPGHGGVMDRLDAFFAVALLVGLVLGVVALIQN